MIIRQRNGERDKSSYIVTQLIATTSLSAYQIETLYSTYLSAPTCDFYAESWILWQNFT